jgi:hypothetical protein
MRSLRLYYEDYWFVECDNMLHGRYLLTFEGTHSLHLHSSTIRMEVAGSCDTLESIYSTTRRQISEASNL